MNTKRRKLRPSVVFVMLLMLVVVAFAVTIIFKTLNYGAGTPNENLLTPDSFEEEVGEETPDDVIVPSVDNEPQADEPIVEEELPELKVDAPRPVYTQEELISMYGEAVLASSDDAGDEYIDRMYFVGDSTTHGMKYYGVLSDGKETTRVWTPRSGTLAMWNLLSEKIVLPEDDSELTIPEAVELKKPDIIVFTLGVNGVSSCTKEQFTGYYKGLIEKVKSASPDTVILLQSIYPVCSDYQYVGSISMEKINNANSWIAELAKENGCYYLNTASVLVDETGYLNPTYSNGDGIHISPEGFRVILEYIRTHALTF